MMTATDAKTGGGLDRFNGKSYTIWKDKLLIHVNSLDHEYQTSLLEKRQSEAQVPSWPTSGGDEVGRGALEEGERRLVEPAQSGSAQLLCVDAAGRGVRNAQAILPGHGDGVLTLRISALPTAERVLGLLHLDVQGGLRGGQGGGDLAPNLRRQVKKGGGLTEKGRATPINSVRTKPGRKRSPPILMTTKRQNRSYTLRNAAGTQNVGAT
ncbi:hypothetical protein ON010_g18419 [Phytophthora cinnamomi]|nr:hypothetical protein ON010_g18419 [Phytophthora cinnamomi]